MRVFFILFSVSVIMLVYQYPEYDPNNPEYFKFFIWNNSVEMTWRNYLWHFGNKIRLVAYMYLFYYLAPIRFKPYLLLFIIMQSFLLIEFILLYHAASFTLLGYKVGLSQLFLIFNALILIHYSWRRPDKLHN